MLTTRAEHNIHGHGRIPLHLLDARQPDEAMTLHLDAPNLDLDLLRALLPGVVIDKGGDAALVADITGRAADPDVKGRLSAHFPRLRIAKAGLDIRDFSADIGSEGKTVRIAAFQGKTKKGEFHLTGTSELPKLNFVLAANDLTLDIPKQLKARMNLTLAITGDLEGPDIAGEVTLNEGTYTQPQKQKRKSGGSGEEKCAAGTAVGALGRNDARCPRPLAAQRVVPRRPDEDRNRRRRADSKRRRYARALHDGANKHRARILRCLWA